MDSASSDYEDVGTEFRMVFDFLFYVNCAMIVALSIRTLAFVSAKDRD